MSFRLLHTSPAASARSPFPLSIAKTVHSMANRTQLQYCRFSHFSTVATAGAGLHSVLFGPECGQHAGRSCLAARVQSQHAVFWFGRGERRRTAQFGRSIPNRRGSTVCQVSDVIVVVLPLAEMLGWLAELRFSVVDNNILCSMLLCTCTVN